MADSDPIVIDPWAGLSHRPLLDPSNGQAGNLAPSWVGRGNSTDVRRVNAYMVLASLIENSSRVFLKDATRKRESREYGDAALIRDSVLAALLGEDLTIQVDGADADKPKPPTADDPDSDAGAGTGPDDDESDLPDDDEDDETFEQQLAEWQLATDRQEWFDAWATRERFPLKVHETERNAIGLSDGVYRLDWSTEKHRTRLRVYDPGFYFPVLSADLDDEFPDRVHLAWEFDDGGTMKVRRITYERVTIAEAVGRGLEIDGATASAAGAEDEVTWTKDYPYADADDDSSTYVTLMTDATWVRQDLKFNLNIAGVDNFRDLGATYAVNEDGDEIRNLDLGVDFLPIVHIPNTVALTDHFGVSCLTRICQILDDVAGTDTDLQAASAITGAPPISVNVPNASGATQALYGPGSVFYGGTVTVADVSKSLDALLKLDDSLLKRLSVNGRVPEEVLGRVAAGDISSGVQLALSFGPFRSLINELRLVRGDKYRLLFKMLQRFAIVGGKAGEPVKPGKALPADAKVLDVEMAFGSFMPNDLKAAVDLVVALVKAHLMSRTIALKMLAGLGIDYGDDFDEELDRIKAEDFEGAYRIAETTGSERDGRTYLQLPGDPDPAATPPNKTQAAPAPTPAAPAPGVPPAPAPAAPAPAPAP